MSHLEAQRFQETVIFYCAYFINFRFNVCVLAALIIGICSSSYFEDLFWYNELNNCSHKNVLLIIKRTWRTN